MGPSGFSVSVKVLEVSLATQSQLMGLPVRGVGRQGIFEEG